MVLECSTGVRSAAVALGFLLLTLEAWAPEALADAGIDHDACAPNAKTLARDVTLNAPSWAPDGEALVIDGVDENGLRIVDMRGSVRILTRDPRDSSPSWSPDGGEILFVNGGDARLAAIPAEGGAASPVLEEVIGLPESPWSPNGKSLIVEKKGGFVVARRDTGEWTWLLRRDENGAAQFLSWQPDGEHVLARIGRDCQVWRIPLSAPESRWRVAGLAAVYAVPGVEGEIWAVGWDPHRYLFRYEDGERIEIKGVGLPSPSFDLHPATRQLVGADRFGLVLVDLSRLSASSPTRVPGDAAPRFSPDASKVAFIRNLGAESFLCVANTADLLAGSRSDGAK